LCDTSASNRAVQNPTPLEPAEGRGTTILNSAMFHTVIKKGWGFSFIKKQVSQKGRVRRGGRRGEKERREKRGQKGKGGKDRRNESEGEENGERRGRGRGGRGERKGERKGRGRGKERERKEPLIH